MNNQVTSDNLRVWDNEGNEFPIKRHDDVWKFFEFIQAKKTSDILEPMRS